MTEIHDRSRAQEHRQAGRVGGTVNARSGAGWKRKGDVRSTTSLYEMKRTDNKRSIRILAEDLETNRRNARQIGKRPVLGFELNGRHYIILLEEDDPELGGEG